MRGFKTGATMRVSIQFKSNGTLHGDIMLTFDGERCHADSYFFAIDPAWFPNLETGETKAQSALRKLLQIAHQHLCDLAQSQSVYVPYDLSDECSAWLRCTRDGDSVTVMRGWTNRGCLFPSVAVTMMKDLQEFDSFGVELRIEREAFLKCLETSICDLQASIDDSD